MPDARAALLYFANWHFLASATDYFAADIDASPFLHFWSLAIEEQFYVVYPVVVLLALRLQRRHREVPVLLIAVTGLGTASLVAQVVIAPPIRSRLLQHHHAPVPIARRCHARHRAETTPGCAGRLGVRPRFRARQTNPKRSMSGRRARRAAPAWPTSAPIALALLVVVRRR